VSGSTRNVKLQLEEFIRLSKGKRPPEAMSVAATDQPVVDALLALDSIPTEAKGGEGAGLSTDP